jgi:hypothetical protein
VAESVGPKFKPQYCKKKKKEKRKKNMGFAGVRPWVQSPVRGVKKVAQIKITLRCFIFQNLKRFENFNMLLLLKGK